MKNTPEVLYKGHSIKKDVTDDGAVQGKGILMIPDLSGFTEFVVNFDLETGRYISQRLLENIIQSNRLGFLISEIEGDAVLFYKFHELPGLLQIKEQIELIYRRFNWELNYLSDELGREIPLSLKIIVHYGLFSTYRIGHFEKLYGPPVVEAHQMLKSRITDSPPYALFSEAFISEYAKSRTTNTVNYIENNSYKYLPHIGLVMDLG